MTFSRRQDSRRTTGRRASAAIAAALFAAGPLALGAQAPTSASAYTRYVTPGQCVAAAARMQMLYWRDKRQDTVVFAPLTDSVPASVKQSARVCASRFTVANTPERELLSLVQLYLWIGQDDQAKAAAERLIAAQASQTPTQRGWIVRLVAESFVNARPTRLADAQRYLALLDSSGAPSAEWRVMAHMRFGELALSLGDVPTAVAQYRAANAAADQLSPTERANRLIRLLQMYSRAAEAFGAENGDSALRLVDKAKGELLALRPDGSRDAQMVTMQIHALETVYQMYGTQGPPLKASHWYTADGDTVRPTPGVASLLIFGNASCGARCYGQYAAIRRLQAKYGDSLKTTIMTGTYGFYRNHPTADKAAESDSVRHYFVDFLKLPAGLAVTEHEFTRKIDGRRNTAPTDNGRNYYRGPSTVLVGSDGKVRLLVNLDVDREKLVDGAIAAGPRP